MRNDQPIRVWTKKGLAERPPALRPPDSMSADQVDELYELVSSICLLDHGKHTKESQKLARKLNALRESLDADGQAFMDDRLEDASICLQELCA